MKPAKLFRKSWKGLWVVIGTVLLLGIAGFILIQPRGEPSTGKESAQPGKIYTCSMHPQVRLPSPGTCPICGMPLIPSTQSRSTESSDPNMLAFSEHAMAMADVETVRVERRTLAKPIRAVGKVQYNETALASMVARVDGYVERLYVDYTGVQVKKGDHMVDLYSPDLLVAQREMLISLENQDPIQIDTARLKLLRWGFTEEQVEKLIEAKSIQERVTLHSPIEGTVIEKLIVEKSPVKSGDVLYRLANLESVWVYLDIYEYELGWIQYGQQVIIRTEAYPDLKFEGRVWFINPIVNEESRTIKALVNIENTGQKLKPGMFVSADIHVPLLSNGKPAPTGFEGQYSCPMHPGHVQTGPGACPICGMDLVQIPGEHHEAPHVASGKANVRYACPMHPDQQKEGPGACPICGMDLERTSDEKHAVKPGDEHKVLAIPTSAVLETGIRKLVYLRKAPGEFLPVEITTGPRADGYYPVLSGLREGDLVATRGNFLLDSQFQINGLPSLFYESGSQGGGGGHQHGDQPGSTPPSSNEHKH
jgi:membrane fusion protein, copper/silver efflux system